MKQILLLTLFAMPFLAMTSCQKQETSEAADSVVIYTQLPEIEAPGQTKQITVFATCEWSMECEKWFSIEPASGDRGISESTITVLPNNTGEARTGVVTLRAGSYTGTYKITQK